ncbi:MAG: dienelactone hydrolase family protein [Gammaproteobacteria bacterium]|nr:dienelactone hydrolase family protein [Gammaproteobacteria bacterium]
MLKWLRRLVLLVVILLAVYGGIQLWPKNDTVVNVFYETSFDATPYGVVGFPTFNAMSGRDIADGGRTAAKQITGGTLALPPDASAVNRVPAMIILHGSGGDWSGRSVNLAMKLARNGIAGLAVDTFAARNLRTTDDYMARLQKAPIQTQMADALSALQALQEHPFVDPARIGVTGFSLGAGSTLYMMFEPVIENVLGKDGPRFSAYAMFYGGCRVDFEDFRVEGSPLLIMMGEADESMSIPACEAFRDRLRDMGVDVALKVYPGAGHGWDNPYPQQFFPDAVVTRDCLMKWMNDGNIIEVNSGQSMDTPVGAVRAMAGCMNRDGYTMGYNENADRQSFIDLWQFLRRTWQLGGPELPIL